MDRPRPNAIDAARRTVRVNVHGVAVEVRSGLPGLRQVIADVLGPLVVTDWPDGFHAIQGSVEPYDPDIVARHLSNSAERVASYGEGIELWRDGDRAWLVDEAWGVCEINPLKRMWRCWVLPHADLQPMRCLDATVFWPMAQVLSNRGLWLVQGPSVVHRGRGVLLLAPFSLEPELSTLVAAGHGLISQRWTALREEAGRQVLLSLPGRVERTPVPLLRKRLPAVSATLSQEWLDLSGESASLPYAWCDVALLIEPGRRAASQIKPLTGASAVAAVRHGWPMQDALHGVARHAQAATRVGQHSAVFHVELSRDPRALLRLLDELPADVRRIGIEATVTPPRRLAAV